MPTTRQRTEAATASAFFGYQRAFHQSHYRNFKAYYIHHMLKFWRAEFPGLVSYTFTKRAIFKSIIDQLKKSPRLSILATAVSTISLLLGCMVLSPIAQSFQTIVGFRRPIAFVRLTRFHVGCIVLRNSTVRLRANVSISCAWSASCSCHCWAALRQRSSFGQVFTWCFVD